MEMHSLMDSIYNSSSSGHQSKAAKSRIRKSSVSPLMIKYLNSGSHSSSGSSLDPFSPPSYGSNCGSPLSAVEGEDVLVMDGILVNSSNSTGSYKAEMCRSWDDFGRCRFGAKCQFAHGKEEVRPNRFPGTKHKSEVTGSPLYGSKGRFVHQTLTDSAMVLTSQTGSPIMKTPTIKFVKSPTITAESEQIKAVRTGGRITPEPEHIKVPAPESEQIKAVQTGGRITPEPEHIKVVVQTGGRITTEPGHIKSVVQTGGRITAEPEQKKAVVHTGGRTSTFITGFDWSPLDDGIKVVLPSQPENTNPSRQDVDAYINSVLYQPSARRRLPVFQEICPE